MKRTENQTRETAQQAYTRLEKDVGNLLELVASQMKVLADRQAKEPKDWGFPGSLAHVRGELKNVLSFLMGGQDEDANALAIDTILAEMRRGK